jgi:hypothetical protein
LTAIAWSVRLVGAALRARTPSPPSYVVAIIGGPAVIGIIGVFSNLDGFTLARRAPGTIIANVVSSTSAARAFKISNARLGSSFPPAPDVDLNNPCMRSTSSPTSFVVPAALARARSWVNEYVKPRSFVVVSDGVLIPCTMVDRMTAFMRSYGRCARVIGACHDEWYAQFAHLNATAQQRAHALARRGLRCALSRFDFL